MYPRFVEEILTVGHLQDSVFAGDVRQHVPHVRDVTIVQHTLQLWPGLIGLVNPFAIQSDGAPKSILISLLFYWG